MLGDSGRRAVQGNKDTFIHPANIHTILFSVGLWDEHTDQLTMSSASASCQLLTFSDIFDLIFSFPIYKTKAIVSTFQGYCGTSSICWYVHETGCPINGYFLLYPFINFFMKFSLFFLMSH